MVTTGAWVAILIASNLTPIAWRLLLHRDVPLWTLGVRIGILVGFAAFSNVSPTLRPLRLYLLALVAALLGDLAIDLITQHGSVAAWVKAVPWRGPVIVHSALKILPVAAMALTVVGLSRRDLFLVRGDLGAPGKIPFTNSTLPWTSLGIILILVFAVAIAVLLLPTLRTSTQLLGRVLPWLPIILLFALINSFTEEFTFRSVLLARLQPVVGGEQALWMTSVRFGLGHWFGNPSGPLGVAGATALGLMLGKSMLETGGIFWAFAIHFILDVVIFSLLIMTAARV